MPQRVDENISTAPAVESESHFLKVGWKMFCRDFMPRSNNAPLEQAKRGFDAVRGHVTVNVDLRAMVDRLVLLYRVTSLRQGCGIGFPFVGHNHVYVFADILFDVLCQRSRLHILSLEEAEFPAALLDADNWNLFALTVRDAPCAVRIPLTTTDPSFVHFERPIHHVLFCRRHRRSDPVTQIPCRLIGASVFAPERPFELHGAHTFLSLADQQYGEKPDRHRQVRIVKDRAACHRKLVLASDTFKRSEEHTSELQSLRHLVCRLLL